MFEQHSSSSSNLTNLFILYGSQTGTAQDLAERIWRKGKSFQFPVKLSCFDKFDMNKLITATSGTLLVCVCSTTGQGDVPDNMLNFWRNLMRKQLPLGILDTLRFTVIGLGDSSYDKYNFVAKKLHKRFRQLGAHSEIDVHLCDEQDAQGIEGTYSKWYQKFCKLLNLSTANAKSYDSNLCRFKIEPSTDSNWQTETSCLASEVSPYFAKLTRNERLTVEDHFQDVRLIELECSTARVKYEAGDVLAVRPCNLKQNVNKFLEIFQHLNLNMRERIQVVSNFADEIQTEPETDQKLIRTVGDLVERYFDLNSVPKMSFFEVFAQLASDELEKEKLEEFLQGENVEDLYNYCYRPRRNIIEVLYDFPKTSRNISNLTTLLDLIPSMKPRYFSIASSPRVHKERVQLLVAIVEYKTRLYESRKGTCSFWLGTLKPEENVFLPVWIKKGSFKVDYTKPLICVGPGTGVAPFRSILNEKIAQQLGKDQNYLFFGCRSRSKDFFFETEWSQMASLGFLQVYTAFSRDQVEKIYVQDLMLKNAVSLFELVNEQGGCVFIAGNSKRMPQDVMAILEKIFAQGLTKIKPGEDAERLAKDYVQDLEAKRQIQLETWS